jgi:hypothetical protein
MSAAKRNTDVSCHIRAASGGHHRNSKRRGPSWVQCGMGFFSKNAC